MGVPEISQSVGMDALRNAYGGIAQDMRDTAAAHGQTGPFDAANQVSTEGHAFMDGPLSRVITTTNPRQETIQPEKATSNVLNGGDTTMQAIRDNLPDAADALAAFNLRRMQQAAPSQAAAYDDTSTGRFLSNVNRMRQQTPGAYNALYDSPTTQQQLDDLVTVAQRLRATERHLSTSGTAEQLGWMQWLTSIADSIGRGNVKELAGNVLGTPLAGATVGRVLTSPMLTRYAAAQGAGTPLLPARTTGLLGSVGALYGQ